MKELLYEFLSERAKVLKRKVKVSLLGFGSTNRAFLDVLLSFDNVDISVRQNGLSANELPTSISVYNGEDSFLSLNEDVIIPSPSIRRERLVIPDYSEIVTDYDLLFRKNKTRLFLVSGSDGKSTTTTLASSMLKNSFSSIFTGGNLGAPLINARADTEAFLLELSSFTLRYSLPNRGRAVLTNVTPNHLDWHDGFEEYRDTKLNLIRRCDEPILNLDDTVSEAEAKRTHTFCLISDTLPHKDIVKRYSTEHTVTVENCKISIDGNAVIPITEIRRREKHNLYNFCSAVALSIGYTDTEKIADVAHSFDGLAERCEVFTIDGVKYVSSSIDTTPLRSATTILGLAKEVNIILGGRGKGLSLEPLKAPLVKYARRISLYGDMAREMCDFIDSDELLREIPHKSFRMLSDAIDHATEGVRSGDTVLLSPAATSYGEFKDYRHRGSFFKDYIIKKHGKI